MRIQEVCQGVGNMAQTIYQMKQDGHDRSDIFNQVFAAKVDDTSWAKAVDGAYHDMFDYTWDHATSSDDAGNISYAKCLDDLNIYQ
ncbi:MAG: hypothetical protein B7Z80_14515 [Rhodospirillales bacterium 20-64-7]|nr:MAG: hypothetical protein B7Z80_14515 [Rhodospirillales bacterium 20-64-7]